MERETWRENGLAPPLPGTDAEKHWAELDKAVPYTKVAYALSKASALTLYTLTSCKALSTDTCLHNSMCSLVRNM